MKSEDQQTGNEYSRHYYVIIWLLIRTLNQLDLDQAFYELGSQGWTTTFSANFVSHWYAYLQISKIFTTIFDAINSK